jgi:hypothetical protein
MTKTDAAGPVPYSDRCNCPFRRCEINGEWLRLELSFRLFGVAALASPGQKSNFTSLTAMTLQFSGAPGIAASFTGAGRNFANRGSPKSGVAITAGGPEAAGLPY